MRVHSIPTWISACWESQSDSVDMYLAVNFEGRGSTWRVVYYFISGLHLISLLILLGF
jgi:hypothetical protein